MTTHQTPTDNKQPSNPQHVMHITKNSKKQTVYNLSQEPTNSSPINITQIHNENTHNLQYMTYLFFFCCNAHLFIITTQQPIYFI